MGGGHGSVTGSSGRGSTLPPPFQVVGSFFRKPLRSNPVGGSVDSFSGKPLRSNPMGVEHRQGLHWRERFGAGGSSRAGGGVSSGGVSELVKGDGQISGGTVNQGHERRNLLEGCPNQCMFLSFCSLFFCILLLALCTFCCCSCVGLASFVVMHFL